MCNKNSTSVDMDVLRSTTDTDKLNLKYENLTDANNDKCIQNQQICNNNNLKNAKSIHSSDCNVVINDDIQTHEQQQQQQQEQNQSSVEQSLESSPQQQQQSPSTYGCKHYKRKAKFVVSADTQTRIPPSTQNK